MGIIVGTLKGKKLLLQIIKHGGNCATIKDRDCSTCQVSQESYFCTPGNRKIIKGTAIKIYIDKYGKDEKLLEVLLCQ